MLSITIPPYDAFDESKNKFVHQEEKSYDLECSLVAISLWESKWKKPFFNNPKAGFQMNNEEAMYFVKCMILPHGSALNGDVYFDKSSFSKIEDYINDSCTATTFSDHRPQGGKSISKPVTSEYIYYWMVSYDVPFECQYWHINRLLTLIRILEVESKGTGSMKRNEIYNYNKALNRSRKQKYKTKG